MSQRVVYTIGHSNHPMETFLRLLQVNCVQVVADVRSTPYSRYNPQFDREALRLSLRESGIQYVFLGNVLGARTDTPSCYERGRVRYDRLALTQGFRDGLARLEKGARDYRVSLMCAEKDPTDCHRTILVGRELQRNGVEVRHILADGQLRTQTEVMDGLMTTLKLRQNERHLFRTDDDLLEDAYRLQGERIAYESDDAKADVSAA